MDQKIRIGIDLGGTKTEIIALAGNGEILLRERVSTIEGDYQATLDTITGLVQQVEQKLNTTGTIGIGTPGALSSHTQCIKNSNSTWLNGQPLQHDLEKILQRKIRIANDANCFALSEAIDGAARDAEVVFGAILGTGVGGGIVVNKKLLQGANSIAGEWGHNPMPWPHADELPGPDCYCGKTGCIETFVSGPGLERDLFNNAGVQLGAQQIVQSAQAGDIDTELAMQRYEMRLAKALASIINVVDPDAIVLGGGMSNIKRLYQQVPKLWGEFVFSDTVTTRLLAPLHGDSSGVRGAAWLWE